MTTGDHLHPPLHTHQYHDRRIQSDIPCIRPVCGGIMRVTMFYAPDRGVNWRQCCCCGWQEIGGDLRRPA